NPSRADSVACARPQPVYTSRVALVARTRPQPVYVASCLSGSHPAAAGLIEARRPMFESVLVPLDGSQLAEAALAPVEEIARTAGSRVFLLHVIRPIERQVEESLPFASVSSHPH